VVAGRSTTVSRVDVARVRIFRSVGGVSPEPRAVPVAPDLGNEAEARPPFVDRAMGEAELARAAVARRALAGWKELDAQAIEEPRVQSFGVARRGRK
jgi:hypothetical protein